jgi:hypothetical protein
MQSSCIPFCLPKFNQSGFVNAFVSFLRTDEYTPSRPVSPSVEGSNDDGMPAEEKLQEPNLNDHGVALICITAGSDVEPVRAWGEAAVKVNNLLMKLLQDSQKLCRRFLRNSLRMAFSALFCTHSGPARLNTRYRNWGSLVSVTLCTNRGRRCKPQALPLRNLMIRFPRERGTP